MKKILLAIFVLVITLNAAVFVSCDRPGHSSSSSEEVYFSEDYPEYLMDKQYNGATVRILCGESYYEYFAEEDSEDVIPVSKYNRNLLVMGRHQVELEYKNDADQTTMLNTMLGVVQSGDQTYDIFSPTFWWQIGNEGMAMDLSDNEILHFEEPWWYQGWNSALVFRDGSQYYCTGSVNELTYTSIACIFMNKTVFNDVSVGYQGKTVEDIQQLVLDGKWTKDVFYEYAKLYGADVNNNFQDDREDDTYANVVAMGAGFQLPAWNVKFKYTETETGYEWSFFTKGFVEKYEEYAKMLNLPHTYVMNEWSTWPAEAFSNNRVLFLTAPLNCYGDLRKGEAEYTILPLTKYDENQKDYYAYGYGATLNAIPACVVEVERASVILEALNYETYKSVLPAIKETTLKNKVANDEGTKKMLDLIFESAATDFAFVNAESLLVWKYMTDGKNGNIASTYFSMEESFNQRLNDFMNKEM